METTEVRPMLETLESNIDDLEESLEPVLKTALSTTTSKLPLLDKAKVFVLATYSLESILFSALRLNGVDAKAHPVFRELARVREYFDKIKIAESGPPKRNAVLDKDAAARFVRHGLSGNDKYDRERTERLAGQRAVAKRKADELEQSSQWGSHNRFAGAAKRIRAQEDEVMVSVVKADEDDESDEEDGRQDESRASNSEQNRTEKKAAKRQRRVEAAMAKQSPASNQSNHGDIETTNLDPTTAQPGSQASILTESGPRSQHQTFQALLQGPLPKTEEKVKPKKKRKGRGEIRQEMEDKRAREMM